MFTPSSLLVLASCRCQSENLSRDQIPLENAFFFFPECFFVLDLHSVTGGPDFLLFKHSGKLLFISSGSPRVVLEYICCLVNTLCQVKNNTRYVFAVSFWSGIIPGAKYALQF